MSTLNDSDLFVVQQGDTVYKVSTSTISQKIRGDVDVSNLPVATTNSLGVVQVGENLEIDGNGVLKAVIPNGINFQGPFDPAGDAPAAVDGDLYISSAAGTLNASWGALQNQVVAEGDGVVYVTDAWKYLGSLFDAGVVGVSGTAPIQSSGGATPVISISPATTDGAGSMSASDKNKLDNIAAGAQIGTVTSVTVTPDKGLSVTDSTSTPVITLAEAGKGTRGSVVFADATAITNGTPLTAAGADDLKVVADKVTALEGADTVSVVAGTNVTVDVNAGAYTVNAKNGSESVVGCLQLASQAEVTAGTDTGKAVTSASVNATYLPRNFNSLDTLP